MTRRISALSGACYFPTTDTARRHGLPAGDIDPDDWRPQGERRHRGWSAHRRQRYPFHKSIG